MHEIDAGNGIHRQDIGRHQAARAADDACGVLAPAPGRGAEVHAANARPQQSLGVLNLRELEYGTLTPSFALRTLDELIVGMFREPTSTAFRTFRHRGWDYNLAVALSEKQKKHLRRLAHPMNPIVMLGNAGLTDAVVSELDRALTDHELVKVSARVGARNARDEALAALASRTRAEIVQQVGNVGVFYRRGEDLAKVLLPD